MAGDTPEGAEMHPKPVPCYLCGRPVVELGLVRWSRARTLPDYITRVDPVCKACTDTATGEDVIRDTSREVTN